MTGPAATFGLEDLAEPTPADLHTHRNGNASPARVAGPRSGILHAHPWSDLGNARRLVDAHGDDLRHVPGEAWLRWTGTRWERDDDGEVIRRASAVADALLGAALAIEDPPTKKAALAFALRSQNARRLSAAVELAAVDERVTVHIDRLDADPFLLGCANGAVDLRTGTLRLPLRSDLLSAASPVHYDPNAECPRFDQFLHEVFDDPDLEAFLQRLVGMMLTGDTREHLLPVLHGSGGNGKSTLVTVLEALLGPDLALTASFETFLSGSSSADYDLARFRAARLVTASESGRGRHLDERIVKQVTGGDTITARHPYGRPFTFRPKFTLLLVTNHRPSVDADDDGLWRRLALIPFERSFEGHEDRSLARTLSAELPGILAWAVRGAIAWSRDGLQPPAAVRTATADYRDTEDTLGTFLTDRCELSPTAIATVAELRSAYEQWAQHNGERPMSAKSLTQALHRRGILSERSKRARLYRGITVTGDDGSRLFSGTPPSAHTGGEFPKHPTPTVTRHHEGTPTGDEHNDQNNATTATRPVSSSVDVRDANARMASALLVDAGAPRQGAGGGCG